MKSRCSFKDRSGYGAERMECVQRSVFQNPGGLPSVSDDAGNRVAGGRRFQQCLRVATSPSLGPTLNLVAQASLGGAMAEPISDMEPT